MDLSTLFRTYDGLAHPKVMKAIFALDKASVSWKDADANLGLIFCKIFENYYSGHKTDVLCEELIMIVDEVLNEN